MKTDEELQKGNMEELKWDPQLIYVSPQTGVYVKDGMVTFSGFADSFVKKVAANHAARRVKEVKGIGSEIDIHTEAENPHPDPEMAEAIQHALEWNCAVKEDKIRVKVLKGRVFLSGEVEWNYQKLSAQMSIENLAGNKKVFNQISVTPKTINTTEIKSKITAAFHRGATQDASSVQIEVKGNKVILRGMVRSFAEKKEAERTVWFAPGVETVENMIIAEENIFAKEGYFRPVTGCEAESL